MCEQKKKNAKIIFVPRQTETRRLGARAYECLVDCIPIHLNEACKSKKEEQLQKRACQQQRLLEMPSDQQ